MQRDAKLGSAASVVLAVSARQVGLVELVETLEQHVAAMVLASPSTPDPELLEALQSLDLLRQSCGDSARILDILAEHVDWGQTGAPSWRVLSEAVHMKQSLDGLDDDIETAREKRKHASNGGPDLWL